MTNSSFRPVILCGGSGTRLWPLSRRSHPKQFAAFFNDESLLQNTLRRVADLGLSAPLLLTSDDYRFVVREQLELSGAAGKIVIEPAGRNTAPAIAAAAEIAAAEDPDAILLVLPSDHVMQDAEAFRTALNAAEAAARAGSFVTFGVTPDRPETGYGYIELSEPPTPGTTQRFVRFVEKPDSETAEAMLESGRFLWNSGIFLMPVAALRAALKSLAPAVSTSVVQSVADGIEDIGFLRLGQTYADAEDISIDYALFEKSEGMVVPVDGGWNDLGSWKTVWQESAKDDAGVAVTGNALASDCEDTLLRAEQSNVQLVGIGLKNIAAIAMRDAVLVTDMDAAQDVKLMVETMRSQDRPQADEFPRCYRPWGWYETLALGPRFQVKQIMVKPGGILSLQSHHHRSEHWIVVAGTAKVTVGDTVTLTTENQSIYVPLGATHRMENPGKVDMHLIEVQTGVYLGEDDIVRYEDVYARS